MWFPRNEVSNNADLQPIVFTRKSLTSTKTCYSKIQREMPNILHDLEKFHHYWFANEVSMITDPKLLEAIFKKDVANLTIKFQRILLQLCQYYIRILHKSWPQLYITQWLSRHNNETSRDKVKPSMHITINIIESCTHIPDCMTAEEIEVTLEDEHLSPLAQFTRGIFVL